MKKLLTVALLAAVFSAQSFASPLVFKIKKNIDSPDTAAELFTLDTTKFQRLRIYVDWSPTDTLKSPVYSIQVAAVEGDDEVLIHVQTVDLRNPILANILIDVPPSKLKVSIRGQGTFRAFVWGQ